MHGIRRIPNGERVVIEVPEANRVRGADEMFPHQAEATVNKPSPSEDSFDSEQGLVHVELDVDFVQTYIPKKFFVDPRYMGKRREKRTRTVSRIWVPATMLRQVH